MIKREQLILLGQASVYGLVGLINTGVDVAIFAALVKMAVNPYVANIFSFGAGSICSLLLNKFITFRRAPVRLDAALVTRFFAATLVTLAISQLGIFVFMAVGLSEIVAKLLSVLMTFVAGFWINRQITFRGKTHAAG